MAEPSGLDRAWPAILERISARHDLPDVDFVRPPTTFGGANFSVLYEFELTSSPTGWPTEFIARVVADPAQTRVEAGLHAAAHTEGLAPPRVLIWDPRIEGLDAGVVVIERLEGVPYLRGVAPLQFLRDAPKIQRSWPGRLPGVITALHRVDVERASAVLEEHGVDSERRRPGWHLQHVTSVLQTEPGLDRLLDWLHRTQPAISHRPVLVHGDLWPANVFLDDGGVRLIDWSRGGIGDPALDVGFAKAGFALMPEPFPPPAPIKQVVQRFGRSVARDISRLCDDLVGGETRVRYFEALRCAVELADVVQGRAACQQPGWEPGVPALVRHAESITGTTIEFT